MPTQKKKALSLLSLIVAGESIFLFPFVIARVFRPTFLETFSITNLELGSLFSAYGVVAIFCYFLGGPLADHFPIHRLLALSLVLTAAGGLYMASLPSYAGLFALYGFFGMSTILFFWASMIKATRIWGDHKQQGMAFGLLDGGRGATGALLSTLMAAVFAAFAGTASANAEALQYILWGTVAFLLCVASFVWWSLRDLNAQAVRSQKIELKNVLQVIKMPTVILQGLIVIFAYCGYKATDDISLYAREVLKMTEEDAAFTSSFMFWLRPLASIALGLLADRFNALRLIFFCFLGMAGASLALAVGGIEQGAILAFGFSVLFMGIAVYGLRGLYFSIMEIGQIPLALTGTAVGVLSIIGYLPDVFFGLLMGYLLDNYEGAQGHYYLFLLIAGFAFLGAAVTQVYLWVVQKKQPLP